jgi:hypothetical protein
MKLYLLTLICLSIMLLGCSEVVEEVEQTEQLYGIQYSVMLEDGFIPTIKVNISGEPEDLNVELRTPDKNVTSKYIFADNLTDGFEVVEFRIAQPGVVPPSGKYVILVKMGEKLVASRNIDFKGPKLIVKNVKFNVSPGLLNDISLTIENEGDTPGFVQHANIKVDDQVGGWLFYEGIEPKKSVNVNILRQFNLKEGGSHINIWLYYKGRLVASYEADISSD